MREQTGWDGQPAPSRGGLLASELGRVRQRGLGALDKRSHNQAPVKVDELANLADTYCRTHGLDLHGRIARIRMLLSSAVAAYGEQGNYSEAELISDLFFDPGDAERDLPKNSAGQLLDLARRRHRPQDEERFADRRRDIFGRFANFLLLFAEAPVELDEAATSPKLPLDEPLPIVQHSASPIEPTILRTRLWSLSGVAAMCMAVALVIAGIVLWFRMPGERKAPTILPSSEISILLTAVGTFLLAMLLSPFFAPVVEHLAASTLGVLWRRSGADLRGRWRSTYRYVSEGQQRVGIQLMKLTQIGKVVHGRNIGGSSPHRHTIRMTLDGDFVTGIWRNTMKGARHRGVLQLRMKANGNEMTGRWIGFDSNAHIQDGEWEWERI